MSGQVKLRRDHARQERNTGVKECLGLARCVTERKTRAAKGFPIFITKWLWAIDVYLQRKLVAIGA